MTRTELLEKICPTHNTDDCCTGENSFHCDDCDKLMESWLDEYDKQVRADERNNVLSILKKLIDSDYNSRECQLLFSDLCEFLLEDIKVKEQTE